MSLINLAGLLEARGLRVNKLHGDELSLETFRELVKSNLSREVLGQNAVGHISPIGAYNSSGDEVLILDTADYKYPYTWVPLETLCEAMQEPDSASGRARGLVEVRLPGTSF